MCEGKARIRVHLSASRTLHDGQTDTQTEWMCTYM